MSGATIAVVDYGMGNLRSVAHALERVAGAARVRITADAKVLANAERVVFPGQGAARDCMCELRARALVAAVAAAYHDKPFLGICMGLQVLFDHSEENAGVDCLGLIPGTVRAFAHQARDPQSGARLAVPQMGWNQVWRSDTKHPLWAGIDEGARFYFCNSYYVDPHDPELVVGHSHYGHGFTCAVARDNVFACQFHPEKSAADGLQLLRNFVQWDASY